MALNFPASPSTGDVHNASNNLSYFFDGVKWITQGSYNTGTINTIKLDSLTSSFNGSLTTFNLTSNSVSVKPANAQSVMISLGGVIQEPTTAYTINSETGTITFASAPASSTAFFGIVYSRLPQSTTTVSDGAITNAKVNATAAIDKSKLNISDATTSASGYMSASDKTKLDGIQGGISAGDKGSLTVAANLTDWTLNDSVVTSAKITDGAIVNADINASAAIAGSKISPDFGSQNITTTGTVTATSFVGDGAVTINNNGTSKVITGSGIANSLNANLNLTFDGTTLDVKSGNGVINAGNITCTGDIQFPDMGIAKFGAGADLQIFHSGNGSFIKDAGTGSLTVLTNQLLLRNAANNEEMITANENAGIKLYFNNNLKFETTTSGVTVTGSVTTQDMNMSNLNGTANEVDNTKGSWSIQEGSEDLFLINRVSGKKYKFNLTEIS